MEDLLELGHALTLLVHPPCYKPKVAVSILYEVIGFFNSRDPSSRIVALGSIQPLTEMGIRNLPGGKVRPARKADSITAVFETIV
jgi:hypothetical protein